MQNAKQIYLIIGCLMIIILAGLLLVIFPFIEEIRAKSQELLHQKTILLRGQQEFASLAEIKKNYSEIEPDLARIDELFIEPKAPIAFVEFLEVMAEEIGLQLKISALNLQPKESDIWQSVAFQVSVAGPFSRGQRFLEKLEAAPFLLSFEALNIERFSEKEIKYSQLKGVVEGDVSLAVSLRVFTKEEKE